MCNKISCNYSWEWWGYYCTPLFISMVGCSYLGTPIIKGFQNPPMSICPQYNSPKKAICSSAQSLHPPGQSIPCAILTLSRAVCPLYSHYISPKSSLSPSTIITPSRAICPPVQPLQGRLSPTTIVTPPSGQSVPKNNHYIVPRAIFPQYKHCTPLTSRGSLLQSRQSLLAKFTDLTQIS